MITQKIAEAKLAKRKLFFKTLLIIVLLSLLSIGLMLWASTFKNHSSQTDSEPSQPTVEPAGQAHNTLDNAALRQRYIEAYSRFENTLKPELNKIDLQQWNAALAEQLASSETMAIKQFGEAKYAQANATIDELIKLAEKTITDSQIQFDTAMQNAQQAFDEDDYQPAKLAITKALILDTVSEQAQALAERIEQLPEIASLVEQIKVAKVENDPQTELTLINKLLTLTPERESYKQRAAELQTAINNKQFQSLLSQSYAALEEERLAVAKSMLNQAKNIYPNRSELNDVNSAIQQYEKQQRVQDYLTHVAQAEAKDDWKTVKSNLEKVISEQPNNKTAADKLAAANDIVSLNQTLEDYLKTPYRLTNTQLAERARSAINQAAPYRQQSPSLAQQSQQLEQILTAVNNPVPVEVRSDNQTYILVRGVGNVGTTDSKVIQLKPGQYTFEGKRQGFKSKLVEVTIPYDVSRYSLTLVCDEPI